MTTLNWILMIIVIVLILLPPKWDPAIRFKEWIESRGKEEK
jgi:hypothetical protein